MAASSKIRHIVRLRQMLQQWRKKASLGRCAPSDVPAGHVAVCVGSTGRRFVVRTAYLNHPVFQRLLVLAEEEYGFTTTGPLSIPCDETLFEEILRFLSQSSQGYCHHSAGLKSGSEFLPESRPLLNGLTMDSRAIW